MIEGRRRPGRIPRPRSGVLLSAVLLLGVLALTLPSHAVAAAAPSLTILSPANDALIGNGSPVAVIFVVSNFNLTKPGTGGPPNPNEGHVALYVDDTVMAQVSKDTAVLPLGSGTHRIRLQLLMDNGTALTPDVRQEVRVTVTQGPTGGAPGISITDPIEGSQRGTDVAISFRLTNFALVPPGGPASVPNEGHIRVYVDTQFYEELTGYEPAHMSLDDGPHNVTMRLVDNAGRPLNPSTSATVHFVTNGGLGRAADYSPLLAYTNGILGIAILALLLLRGKKGKR